MSKAKSHEPKPHSKKCIVFGCQINGKQDYDKYSFYQIPIKPQRRRAWLKVLGKTELDIENTFTQTRYVCSKHFKLADFGTGRKLIFAAVPSMFIDKPDCKTNEKQYYTIKTVKTYSKAEKERTITTPILETTKKKLNDIQIDIEEANFDDIEIKNETITDPNTTISSSSIFIGDKRPNQNEIATTNSSENNITKDKLNEDIIITETKSISSYKEALEYLRPLEEFVLIKADFRAANFINNLEEIFKSKINK